MKRILVILTIITALVLTACGGSGAPDGVDQKAWNAGNKALQYLDEWEEGNDQSGEAGIAAKIMKEAGSFGNIDALIADTNKTEKEQYISDMYFALFAIAGYIEGKTYPGAVFSISADGKTGKKKDYDYYYECKQKLIDLLQIEYEEDYTLLDKR